MSDLFDEVINILGGTDDSQAISSESYTMWSNVYPDVSAFQANHPGGSHHNRSQYQKLPMPQAWSKLDDFGKTFWLDDFPLFYRILGSFRANF